MNKPFLDLSGSTPATAGEVAGKPRSVSGDDAGKGRHAPAAMPSAATATTAERPAGSVPPRSSATGATTGAARPGARAPAGPARRQAAIPRQQPARTGGHGLMIAVFVLSALVGGGVAGLFLAMQGAVDEAPDNLSGSASIPVIARATPDAATPATPATTSQPRAQASADRQQEKAAATPPAKVQDRIVATAPAAAARSGGDAEASAAADTPVRRAAVAPDAADLRQLTEQVVSALGALGRAERQGSAEATAAGTDRLRASLADLVDAALASGKTDAEIRALVSEALGNAADVPALLRDASGKVDVGRLLASIMPDMQADAVPMSRDDRDYYDQLAAEADTTSTEERVAATRAGSVPSTRKRASGRFFIRDGKRYTIVRKGDTLSDIAYAAYGDVLAYSAILRANRGRITARALKPGTRILIPDIKPARKVVRKKNRRRGAVQDAPAQPVRTATGTEGNRTTAAAGAQNGSVAVRPQPVGTPAIKVMNFRSARDGRPVPLTPAR